MKASFQMTLFPPSLLICLSPLLFCSTLLFLCFQVLSLFVLAKQGHSLLYLHRSNTAIQSSYVLS